MIRLFTYTRILCIICVMILICSMVSGTSWRIPIKEDGNTQAEDMSEEWGNTCIRGILLILRDRSCPEWSFAGLVACCYNDVLVLINILCTRNPLSSSCIPLKGVYHRWEYFRVMALVYRLKPHIFTAQWLRHFPKELTEMMPLSQEKMGRGGQEDFETCIWIDVHVDGVEFFENSKNKSVSGNEIIGCVHVLIIYQRLSFSRVKFCRSVCTVWGPLKAFYLKSSSPQGNLSPAALLCIMARTRLLSSHS